MLSGINTPYVEILNQFDKFCALQSVEEPVLSADLFSKWCEKRLQENDTTHHMRISAGSFAEFRGTTALKRLQIFTRFASAQNIHAIYLHE